MVSPQLHSSYHADADYNSVYSKAGCGQSGFLVCLESSIKNVLTILEDTTLPTPSRSFPNSSLRLRRLQSGSWYTILTSLSLCQALTA